MLELERTFLLRNTPSDLVDYPSVDMLDIYVPEQAEHPTLRIRKQGDAHQLTKKQPRQGDPSVQTEETVPLTADEYESLQSQVAGKRVSKRRYNYRVEGVSTDIDLFTGPLHGLGMADFEFNNEMEMRAFEMPRFCLADVSQLDVIAGGLLAGKKYEDIDPVLKPLGYSRLSYTL